MIYKIEKRDLFSVDDSYYFAQCISADFTMESEYGMKFNRKFRVKEKIKTQYQYGSAEGYWDGNKYECHHGFCIATDRVFNLVNKRNFWNKPTLSTMKMALFDMKQKIGNEHIKLAMPKIGCEIDKMSWEEVSELIKEVFFDTDVEILVCYIDEFPEDVRKI